MKMDEKGVSPVIGVILMVAITVILAAVIASFVFGLGGTVKPVKTPGFSVSREAVDNVSIVLTSMGGANTIGNCSVAGANLGGGIQTGWDWRVGQVIYVDAGPGTRVVITCEVDGIPQVVLDSRV
ncbi:MAG: type IV pilin N-terminal domain-containing protein [Archaeoglobales archaeon]|nr:type IV pilin N-terminal domain-containing protein [Archaeoglobales archaeon]